MSADPTSAAPPAVLPTGALTGTWQAVAMIITAMACFSVQDVVVKLVASEVSLWQMQAIRSVAVGILLGMAVFALGRTRELWPRRLFWPLVRAVLMCGAYLCFYAALPYLDLAKAASAFFIGPLLITVFAALLLGEPIGPRRIIAVVVGFIGVLFIVQPGMEGWKPVAVLPVAAAFCYAFGVVLTRWRCREDPGFALTMVHNLLYALIGVLGLLVIGLVPVSDEVKAANPFLTSGWLPLALPVLFWLLLTACTHIGGVLTSIWAYQRAEASRLAPFEYSYLVMMGAMDYLIWGVLPTEATLAGMLLICGAGGFVAWREGRPARPRIQQNAELPWTPDEPDGNRDG